MSQRVLVRTDNEEFGSEIGAILNRKGAKVRVTPSLNEAGNALVRGENPLYKLNKPYHEVLLDALGIAFFGYTAYERLSDRINGPRYNFVVFDPNVAKHDIDRRFLDTDMRSLELRCQVDRTQFSGEMGWERNYLGYWHFLTGEQLAELPDEYVRGLAFMQEIKQLEGRRIGHHPKFPFVFASDDERIRGFAKLMHSFGFVDYREGVRFENADWLEKLDAEEREALGLVTDYLSSGARAAITTSALALAIPATPALAQMPQPEIRITSNNSPEKSGDFNCVGYWIGGPRGRICIRDVTDPSENISLGLYLPPSKNMIKLVWSRNSGHEDFGVYFHDQFGQIQLGAGTEFYGGKFSGEAHAVMPVPLVDRIYLGYSNNGEQTLVIAVQPDIGDMRFALVDSFGEVGQLKAYAAKKGRFKFFYTDDRGKETKLFNGFVRFGDPKFGPYLDGGMNGERFDITQAPNVHTAGMLFNAALFPDNTHLSDHGWLAFAPKFLVTPDGSILNLRAFYTHEGRLIAGYGITRTMQRDSMRYEHALSAGANIGPFKIIGNYEIGRGPGLYAGFKANLR